MLEPEETGSGLVSLDLSVSTPPEESETDDVPLGVMSKINSKLGSNFIKFDSYNPINMDVDDLKLPSTPSGY